MGHPIQQIKRHEEFYNLCNSIHKKDQSELIKQLEDIIQEENLNPCQIKAPGDSSLMGFVIIQDRAVLANVLAKYADDSKTPDELKSVWKAIAFTGKKTYLNTFIKKGDFSNLTKTYEDGTNNLSPCVYKTILSKRKKGNSQKFLNSVNYESVFNDLVLFYLDKGVNINTFYKSSYGKPTPLVSYLFEPFKFRDFSTDYKMVLNTVLRYGFDINLCYNPSKGNNFIQHFCIQHCTKKDDLDSFSVKMLLKMIENQDIDLDYKNGEGLNLFEILEKREFHNILNILKPLYEKKHITDIIDLDNDIRPINKKRL